MGVETSTRKVSKLSRESCKIESQSIETQDNKVEFASKQESRSSEIIETRTVDETRPDKEIEDDLERKKEKKPENQASGMQETQRVLHGEQMEETYLAPGKEGTPERIIFTLHSAKDLANMDYMGKSDPYAILTYGSQERRTTTINNNLNPIWNHQVTFDFDENAPTIDIEVFDEDTMATDDSLGRLSIDVAEIKRNKNVADAEASFEKSSSGSIKYSGGLVTGFTSSTSYIID